MPFFAQRLVEESHQITTPVLRLYLPAYPSVQSWQTQTSSILLYPLSHLLPYLLPAYASIQRSIMTDRPPLSVYTLSPLSTSLSILPSSVQTFMSHTDLGGGVSLGHDVELRDGSEQLLVV